jgi:glycosyltransferase involved in cell wall biosynthesis
MNQALFIERTLRSVRDQDYPYIDHIVIDGGSTDSTIDILNNNTHVKWISEPYNAQAEAINKGFRAATRDIIGWLNSDDVYLPGAVTGAVQFLTRNTEYDLVYSDHMEIDDNDVPIARRKTVSFDLEKVLHKGNPIPQPSVFFRSTVFERVGYLNEKYQYAMDLEYWIRIAKSGLKIAHVSSYWAAFRMHDNSKTVADEKRFGRRFVRLRFRTELDDCRLFSIIIDTDLRTSRLYRQCFAVLRREKSALLPNKRYIENTIATWRVNG